MTPECPNIASTSSYPIGEAAKLLGMSPRHLLRLAASGCIKYTVNRRNGRKRFSGREIKRFWNEY